MLAVIGGSGLSRLAGFEWRATLPGLTAYGEPSSPLQQGVLAGCEIMFLARHGDPHRLPPHRVNYRANLRALADAGVDRVLAINTVGGIHAAMVAGHFVVPHDIVDYTWGREHTFSDGTPGSELQHVDFSAPFDPGMRGLLVAGLQRRACGFSDFGVYAAAQGPRLESPAEIRRFERDGCDIVGMTAMPEASLARELGLRYAMLCLVVNPAAGKTSNPLTVDDMHRVVADGMDQVRDLLVDFVAGGG